MLAKAVIITVMMVAFNYAWAQGGLSIDNNGKRMHSIDGNVTNTAIPAITTQGPVGSFETFTSDQANQIVDVEKLKQSFNGQS